MRNSANEIHFENTATLAGRMERDRQDRLAKERDRAAESAEIREKAKAFDNLANPAESIRRILAGSGDLDELLPIYHSWLRRDHTAALSSLSKTGNFLLSRSREIGDILVDVQGESWADEALASDAIPYPLRLALAENAGRQAGWHGGLARLLKSFGRTRDSRLRATIADWFVGCWLLEDPKQAAHFLAKEAPSELRDLLLVAWREPHALGYSWYEWRDAVNTDLKAHPLPDYAREIAETFPHTEGPGFGMPRPPDDTPFAEAIRSGEGSAEDRLASAMQWKVRGWIEEGTDLRELYCEKRISRQELLDGLKVRIPGSEAHPLELERAAWTETLPCSDPEQASEWGRELLRRGDLSRLLDDARREFSKDPRGSLKLDRLHVAIALNPKGWALPMLLEDVVKEWKDWEELSPPDARRWRALMKEDDPMARAIRNTGAGEKTIGVEK
jgi:hypothetical protein